MGDVCDEGIRDPLVQDVLVLYGAAVLTSEKLYKLLPLSYRKAQLLPMVFHCLTIFLFLSCLLLPLTHSLTYSHSVCVSCSLLSVCVET